MHFFYKTLSYAVYFHEIEILCRFFSPLRGSGGAIIQKKKPFQRFENRKGYFIILLIYCTGEAELTGGTTDTPTLLAKTSEKYFLLLLITSKTLL